MIFIKEASSRVRYIQIDIWWLRLRKRSRLGPLSRLPRKSGVRRFKSLVSWDCRIFWRYITAAVIYTIQFATSSQCVYGVSGVVRSSSSQRGTGQPTPLEREMREEGGLYATIDKIIPRSSEKNYIGSLPKILSNLISRGEGESNIEIFVNETCCFFSLFFFFSPPSTKLIGGFGSSVAEDLREKSGRTGKVG